MTSGEPTFSIVVSTTDRALPLRTLLRSLEHQTYSQFEVLVVVGPTHDGTLDVLAEYASRVRVLRCPTANLSRSRNIGVRDARGEIVAFIDDDAVPSNRWLEQLARLFANPRLDATGGVVYAVHPNDSRVQHRLGAMSSLAEQQDVCESWLDNLAPHAEGLHRERHRFSAVEGRQWLTRMMGTNMAYRRAALLSVGGFDEFYEWVFDESDLAFRQSDAGQIVHPVRECAVYHVPASSRNRVVFTQRGNWWIQTKAGVYFTIRHGRRAGDALSAIALRCLHLVHGHWLYYDQLQRTKKIPRVRAWRACWQELRAGTSGALHAFGAASTLASVSTSESSQPMVPFQNEQSAQQPSVDPVSGYRPAISLPDSPLRICLLSSAYPPMHYDGVGRSTNVLARGLFECGHSVNVVTRGDTEQVAFYDGAYVHQLPTRLDRYAAYHRYTNVHYALNHSHAAYDMIRRLILNDGIQIVDSPIWQVDGLVTAVSQVAPVVVRIVTAVRQISALQNERHDDARLMGEMESALIQRAAHLIHNTRATMHATEQVYAVQPETGRFSIVPYGIVPAPDDAVRPFDLSRQDDALTVLFVGRLEKRKGILDLFEAIPRVLRQLPTVQFVIAGADNSQHDGFQARHGSNYATYFTRRNSALAAHVQFLGAVSEENLQALYQACDLFVAPSLYESFGLIYLEAMNYAKPVIGCNAGGIPEVVEHGVTGLLVEPEAPDHLAEALVSLLQSRKRLREMGLAGRQRLLDKFTHIQMARGFERAYRAVVSAQAQLRTGERHEAFAHGG